MTDWTDAAKISFGLMVSAFVMGLIAYYFYVGKNINNELSKQDANRELMREYREYSGFNGKVVYAQDVVSLVLEKRGDIGVRILSGGTLQVYWADGWAEEAVGNATDPWTLNPGAKRNTYTATAVSEELNLDKSYYGTLAYGANGEVLGVTFKTGTVDGTGNFVED